MIRVIKQRRAAKLLRHGAARRIVIHSVARVPAFSERPKYVRIAFEFLDPPGPWSMQFFEAEVPSSAILSALNPGVEGVFYESRDGAATRVLKTAEGHILWPR